MPEAAAVPSSGEVGREQMGDEGWCGSQQAREQPGLCRIDERRCISCNKGTEARQEVKQCDKTCKTLSTGCLCASQPPQTCAQPGVPSPCCRTAPSGDAAATAGGSSEPRGWGPAPGMWDQICDFRVQLHPKPTNPSPPGLASQCGPRLWHRQPHFQGGQILLAPWSLPTPRCLGADGRALVRATGFGFPV